MGATRKRTSKPRGSPSKSKRGRGRPQKKLDLAQVEAMAAIGLTMDEIGHILDVSRTTLWQRAKDDPEFLNVLEKGQAKRNAGLRRRMWEGGVRDGNPTLLIWLSKNLLGWSDKNEHVHAGDAQRPLVVKGTQFSRLSVEELATLNTLLEKAEREGA